MSPLRFVADSTADLPADYRTAKRILTVPLRVVFGDEALIDGVEIDAAGFYSRMRSCERNPTTSQPAPAAFEAAFREAAEDGASVICTVMSSEMSGTHQSAVAAREACAELDVTVIDTQTVSIGHHLILRSAVAAAEAGAERDQVVALIGELMARQRSLFTVTTLEYLHRGGRIGGGRALLGSVLNIKPILQVVDGRIDAYDRVRTNPRALERIAGELIAAAGETGRRALAAVGHADRVADCHRLAEMVAPHCAEAPYIVEIGPIVGAHAGPGCLGMSFHLEP